jgi:heterotetrameric sarcosine oxidase gamma subunit
MADQNQFNPVRRGAMYHKHVESGALMVERDGYSQPAHFGSAEADARHLLEAVGFWDIGPRAKFVIKGEHLEQLVTRVFPAAKIPDVGDIGMAEIAGGEQSASAALCRLAEDEILCVAPAGQASTLAEGLNDSPEQCAHALDISSGLAGVGIAGPESYGLLSAMTELDTSQFAFPNLGCAQSKFADIHGTLLRIDHGEFLSYQLYFPREFGEYLWDALLEAAEFCGGGPVGFETWDSRIG